MTMASGITSLSGTTEAHAYNLNLTESLHKAAVKLLTKRNVIQGAIETNALDVATIQEQPTKDAKSSMDNTLLENIATIRKNVSQVLQIYFRTLNTSPTKAEVLLGRQTDNLVPDKTASTSSTMATTSTQLIAKMATTMTSQTFPNSTYYNSSLDANNVISSTMDHLADVTNATMATTATPIPSSLSNLSIVQNITYPNYAIPISSSENCSALFTNYTPPIPGLYCNWTWDMFTCWPPTPAGVLAHMGCPSGFHGVDARKFANRKCELNGHWSGRPNEPPSPNGWTDYNPCFKPEVKTLLDKVPNLELVVEIAKRTRTLEIVGLILSLVALILSLIIFCNFRSLRNNRTKIHKNLFIAMVLQVVIRLSLYLDQAFRRDKSETKTNTSLSGIENTPYLCETSYILLEYAKTAMFMWMFIEGWYLHNMVTVSVFQGKFPYKIYSIVGWGVPVFMTTIWGLCTAFHYADTMHDCWWNYNLTPYYWILEGPRIVIITINFAFLLNIIRVLVVKLRESQASDIEQTRKAVRAAIVLLPLLGTINVLYLIPTLETPWKFALWSYATHFLNTFQGFFIALIYCFLNGEVRAVLLKSVAVYMSVRGHPEWVPKRASMYSGGYNTAHDTENPQGERKGNGSPSSKRTNGRKGSKGSNSTVIQQSNSHRSHKKSPRLSHSNASGQPNHHLPLPPSTNHQQLDSLPINNNNAGSLTSLHNLGPQHIQYHQHRQHQYQRRPHHSWLLTLCFRGQKVLRVPPASSEPPETNV
ncbi:pigment-dispersing factor receptor isoform X2 [Haematobia irritans]|uniref:pigment-dispersing factor receptor isoform X2 n=1 Tax=Haematobia irritans TaxID=7368 RepID=UPI003F5053F7